MGLFIFCGFLCQSQQNISQHPFVWNLGVVQTDSTLIVHTQVFDTLFRSNNRILLGTSTQEIDLYGNQLSTTATWPFSDDGDAIVRDTSLLGYHRYISMGDTLIEFGFLQRNHENPSPSASIPLYMLQYNPQGDTIAIHHLPISNDIQNSIYRFPIQYSHELKLSDSTFFATGYIGNNSQNMYVLYMAKIHINGTILNENLITRYENPEIFWPEFSLFHSEPKNEIHLYLNESTKFIIEADSLTIKNVVGNNFAGFTNNAEEIKHPKYKYISVSSWDGENPATNEQLYETENNSDVFLFLLDDSLNVDTVQIKLPDAEAIILESGAIDYVDDNNIYLGVSHHVGFHYKYRYPGNKMNVGFSMVKCNIQGEVLWSKKIYEFYEDLPNGGHENVANVCRKVIGLDDGGMIAIVLRYFHERPEAKMDVMFIRTDADGNLVSVNTIDPKVELSLFPNPASNELHVKMEAAGKFQYFITNLAGQTMRTGTFTPNQTINIEGLPSGTYIFTLQSAIDQKVRYQTFQKI